MAQFKSLRFCISFFLSLLFFFFWLNSQADSFHMPAKALNKPRLYYPHTLKSSREERSSSSCRKSRGKPWLSHFWSCAYSWSNLSIQVGGTHCMVSGSWAHTCHRRGRAMWMTIAPGGDRPFLRRKTILCRKVTEVHYILKKAHKAKRFDR